MTDSIQGASLSLAKIKQALAKASFVQWTDDDGTEMLEGSLDTFAGAALAAFDSPAKAAPSEQPDGCSHEAGSCFGDGAFTCRKCGESYRRDDLDDPELPPDRDEGRFDTAWTADELLRQAHLMLTMGPGKRDALSVKLANRIRKHLDFPPKRESSALADIAAERHRQIEKEGWTPEHDDEHSNGEMADAAAAYAIFNAIPWRQSIANRLWPWDVKWWKPKTRRQNLVRAAALIVAEIERIDRPRTDIEGQQP